MTADEPRTLDCPKCGRTLNVSSVPPGKRVRCPGCKQVLTVPEAPGPADADPGRTATGADLRQALSDSGVSRTGLNPYDLVGETVGGCKVLSKIAAGGMGVVYRARQLSLKREVALKVLNSDLAADKSFVERFVSEARAAAELNHPNLVTIHDVGEDRGVYFFTMEYVLGKSCKMLLEERGRFSPGRVLDVMLQTARALEHASRKSIIHRDIKPDNILMTPEGAVKVADLGLARKSTSPEQTDGNMTLGTPYYMAPEQARNPSGVDGRADIYALGATAWHLIAGRPPHDGDDPLSILVKAADTDAVPLHEDDELEVPFEVSRVIQKMMERDPDDRYQHVSLLMEDLQELRKGSMPFWIREEKARIRREEEAAAEAARDAARRKAAPARPAPAAEPGEIADIDRVAGAGGGLNPRVSAGIVGGILLVGLIVGLQVLGGDGDDDGPDDDGPAPVAGTDTPGGDDDDDAVPPPGSRQRTLMEDARRLERDRPEALHAHMDAWEAVLEAGPDTTAGVTARGRLAELQDDLDAAAAAAWTAIAGDLAAAEKEGRLGDARALVDEWLSRWDRARDRRAAETADERVDAAVAAAVTEATEAARDLAAEHRRHRARAALDAAEARLPASAAPALQEVRVEVARRAADAWPPAVDALTAAWAPVHDALAEMDTAAARAALRSLEGRADLAPAAPEMDLLRGRVEACERFLAGIGRVIEEQGTPVPLRLRGNEIEAQLEELDGLVLRGRLDGAEWQVRLLRTDPDWMVEFFLHGRTDAADARLTAWHTLHALGLDGAGEHLAAVAAAGETARVIDARTLAVRMQQGARGGAVARPLDTDEFVSTWSRHGGQWSMDAGILTGEGTGRAVERERRPTAGMVRVTAVRVGGVNGFDLAAPLDAGRVWWRLGRDGGARGELDGVADAQHPTDLRTDVPVVAEIAVDERSVTFLLDGRMVLRVARDGLGEAVDEGPPTVGLGVHLAEVRFSDMAWRPLQPPEEER